MLKDTKTLLFLLLLAASAATGALADSPWGIMSHPLWSKNPRDLEMEVKRTKAAGMKYFRTDFGFGGIAKSGDRYDFARYDDLVNQLDAAGIEVLPVLQGYDWSVRRSRPDAVPLYKHPETWRKFIRAVAEHYKGRIHAYEIWNEQDGGFWKPSPNAAQYVPLLKIAYQEIKAVDPDAKVIVGGLCGWNSDYMRDLYSHGGKGFFDAVAVHPYGWGPDASPATAAAFNIFKKMMTENGDSGKELWLTEFGTSTFRSSLLDQQKDVILRAIELAMKKTGRAYPKGVLTVGVPVDLRNPVDEDALPRAYLPGAKIVKLTPEELAKLNPAEIPVVIGCETLRIQADYLKPSMEYVRKGGILLAFGQVPYYVKEYKQPNGNWISKDSVGELHELLRIGFDAWWTDNRIPESTFNVRTAGGMDAEGIKPLKNIYVSRVLNDKNLKPGDTYTPIVHVLGKHGEVVGEGLALYTFGDRKGAILGCTLLYHSGLSEEEQANFIVRNYLAYLAGGVSKLFVYNLRDKGTNPAENEANFGIVKRDFTPKKAYLAYCEMTAALGAEPEFVKDVSPSPAVKALLFKRGEDDKPVLATWAIKPETVYAVDGTEYEGVKVRLIPIFGQAGNVSVR